MEIAKKITLGGINGVRNGFKDVTVQRLVARIFGIVRSMEVKDTTFGKSFKFVGDFRAINQDGEEIAAPVCFLPSPADSMLVEALNATPGSPVNFGFDIFVSPKDRKTPQDLGYEYRIKPLLDTKPSNPMVELMNSVAPLVIDGKKPAEEQKPLELSVSEAKEDFPVLTTDIELETAGEKVAPVVPERPEAVVTPIDHKHGKKK